MLCRLVLRGGAGQWLGHALLPVQVANRPGDERTAVRRRLGLKQIRGVSCRGQIAAGAERYAPDMRVRQLPVAAAQRGPAQFHPPDEADPGRTRGQKLRAEGSRAEAARQTWVWILLGRVRRQLATSAGSN